MKRNAGSFSTAYRTNLKLLPTLSMAFSFIDVLVQRLLGGFLWILRHRQDKALDQRSLVHGRSVLAEGMEGVFWVSWIAVVGFSTQAAEHASVEAQQGMKQVEVPVGYELQLAAAEPNVLNMIALSVDVDGRIYLAETDRYQDAVFDVVTLRPDWLPADLSFRQVRDRTDFLKQQFRDDLGRLGRGSERLRRLEDRDGDGWFEVNDILAQEFRSIPTGPAAGVLAHRGQVWFQCLPTLWRIEPSESGNHANDIEALLDGFGVHVGVSGHDLHGITWGPEGRLYFTIGDRGMHVTQQGFVHAYPDTGCVLRCEPDGSHLEVVAVGLRNPQELAFDPYGSLFAGDNDTAGADRSRLLHIVRDGDYGWRCSYQHMKGFGPWVEEGRWKGDVDDVLPSAGYVAQGPSGFAVHPEAGRRSDIPGPFFLSDFPGGIRQFDLKPQGATYRAESVEPWLWQLWATDMAFGPDGAMYVADWVAGWQQPNKGRLYRLSPNDSNVGKLGQDVRHELKRIRESSDTNLLVGFLDHPNLWLRREAQFQLAEMGPSTVAALLQALEHQAGVMGRLHALWCLNQHSRSEHELHRGARDKAMLLAMDDPHPAVRRVALEWMADRPEKGDLPRAMEATMDASPMVRLHAWLALSRAMETVFDFGSSWDIQQSLEKAFGQLDQGGESMQAHLKHGIHRFIAAWIKRFPTRFEQQHQTWMRKYDVSARMGMALAMKRLKHPSLGSLLDDPSPEVSGAAMRAIYEARMNPLGDRVMEWTPDMASSPGVWKRWLWTFYYQANTDQLQQLLEWLQEQAKDGSQTVSDSTLLEAVHMLSQWDQVRDLDPVDGLWRPGPQRNPTWTFDLWESLTPLMDFKHVPLTETLLSWGLDRQWPEIQPWLERAFMDVKLPDSLRARALAGLIDFDAESQAAWLQRGLRDDADAVRSVALKVYEKTAPGDLQATLTKWWEDPESTMAIRRLALQSMWRLSGEQPQKLRTQWWQQFLEGEFPPALRLELLELVQSSDQPESLAWWQHYRQKAQEQEVWPFATAVLEGGHLEAGRDLFLNRAEIACLRCHQIEGQGGVVGPSLDHLGDRLSAEAILEAILEPNASVTPGYISENVVLHNEEEWVGVVTQQDETTLTLRLATGALKDLPLVDIAERLPSLSAMPEGLMESLKTSEVRDLIAYLKSLKKR